LDRYNPDPLQIEEYEVMAVQLYMFGSKKTKVGKKREEKRSTC
jgi:hypothetical protein